MIYGRAVLAFLGALLMVFSFCRISWQFVQWGVLVVAKQSPPFVGTDPRLRYRPEAFALAVGAALFFLAAII